jgi:hypothetical protein
MFALIETNNATHIAIHIPSLGADKTLPAIAGMLEHNAVFIQKGYGTLERCKPNMSIILGNKYSIENRDAELAVVVPKNDFILGEDFVLESPEVRISNAKAIKERESEINRLRTELAHYKQQLQDLQDRINAAAEPD